MQLYELFPLPVPTDGSDPVVCV